MQKIQGNERILISMTANVENGEVFDEIPIDQPLEVQLGSGKLFETVEKALIGMQSGESRTVQIPPEYAYGPEHKNLIHSLNRNVFGDKLSPEPGMVLSLTVDKDGSKEKVPATVMMVNDEEIVVNFNHPLAGQTLVYTVNLHQIFND